MTRVALKRLKKEYDEIERSQAELPFTVHPLEDNFLEWHFTLQGASDSPFEGGFYHGRLIFPADYPFSPPTLMFLTPNGRFQTNTKICLSVTGFHPEHWQPAWGARTMLIAIRDHFTVEDRGAIGYLGFSGEDRRQLARASQSHACRGCGYRGSRQETEEDVVVRSEPTVQRMNSANNVSLSGIIILAAFAVLIIAVNYLYS